MGYYGEISKGYDKLHFEEQSKKAALINANIEFSGLLLDIGAGTGSATRLFESKAQCITLDPAKEMLKQYGGLRVVGKAEQLPFKDSTFDSIVSLTALHHCSLQVAFNEIKRVAKPDASIAISFFTRAANFLEAKKLFTSYRLIEAGPDTIFLNK